MASRISDAALPIHGDRNESRGVSAEMSLFSPQFIVQHKGRYVRLKKDPEIIILSLSRTRRIFSNAAPMSPFRNRICPKPWMLENSSQPSSRRTIAFLKPSFPWNKPASCTTFSRARILPSSCSSSPVMIRKAKAATSSISAKRSAVGTPAVDTLLDSSTTRLSRSVRKSFSTRQSNDLPRPMKMVVPSLAFTRSCLSSSRPKCTTDNCVAFASSSIAAFNSVAERGRAATV
jgi:hypothetical protein